MGHLSGVGSCGQSPDRLSSAGKSNGLLLHIISPQVFPTGIFFFSALLDLRKHKLIHRNPKIFNCPGVGGGGDALYNYATFILGGRWWYSCWTGGGGAECSQGASETVRQQHHSVERTATGVAGFRPRLGTDAARTTSESHVTYIPQSIHCNAVHGAL